MKKKVNLTVDGYLNSDDMSVLFHRLRTTEGVLNAIRNTFEGSHPTQSTMPPDLLVNALDAVIELLDQGIAECCEFSEKLDSIRQSKAA